MIVAASSQRSFGWVVFAIVFVGFAVYVLFNMREGRKELGSEIELAPNRKPYYEDDELENNKLTRSLMFSLVMLALISVGLPAYWLGEPARHENAEVGKVRKDATRGKRLFDEFCVRCHGGGGVGGVAPFTITDEAEGGFVAQVQWTAPALTGVLTRFDESEVRYILNYGRGVMPAWGTIGGGAMTDQQLTELITYLRSVQYGSQVVGDEAREKAEKDLRATVRKGVEELARPDVILKSGSLTATDASIKRREADLAVLPASDLKKRQQEAINADKKRFTDEVAAAVKAYVEALEKAPAGSAEQRAYGRYLFNNQVAGGEFNCARCHTKGASYAYGTIEQRAGATPIIAKGPLGVPQLVDGGGWFGPNLTNGVTKRQFETEATHDAFISEGSKVGAKHGQYGQGSGKMPGFGPRTEASCPGIPKTPDPKTSGDLVNDCVYLPLLTEAQIAAIVAYERSL